MLDTIFIVNHALDIWLCQDVCHSGREAEAIEALKANRGAAEE